MSFSSINDILHTTTLETLNYFRCVYLNLKHTRIANTKTSLLVCANRAGSLVFACKFNGFKSLWCEIRTAYSFMFTHALRYPYTPIISKWNCFSLWFAVLVVPRSCYYNDNRPWRGCEEQFESESFYQFTATIPVIQSQLMRQRQTDQNLFLSLFRTPK